MGKAKATHSSSSSTDSSKHPILSSASSSPLYHHHRPNTASNRNLITDLRLGLTISTSTSILDALRADSRKQASSDWPPLKPLLRSSLAERESGNHRQIRPTFFVKVHMKGVSIGRKVDLLAHHDYDGLITTLAQMFRTTILYPDMNRLHSERNDHHVLTYEDKEGDWMMAGDVPWEIFLTTVRRLKIAGSAGKC